MLTHYAVNVDTIIAVYSSSEKVKKLPNMFQLSSSKESSGFFSFPLSPNSLINVRDKTTQLLLWALPARHHFLTRSHARSLSLSVFYTSHQKYSASVGKPSEDKGIYK